MNTKNVNAALWDERKELKEARRRVMARRIAVGKANTWSAKFLRGLVTLFAVLCNIPEEKKKRSSGVSKRKILPKQQKIHSELLKKQRREQRFQKDVKAMKSWSPRAVPATRLLLQTDMAKNLEDFPIPVYTETRTNTLFHSFDYIKSNIISKDAKKIKNLEVSCDCTGGCGDDCLCRKANEMIAGTKVNQGRFTFTKKSDVKSEVFFSCGEHCGCKGNCCNSVKKMEIPHQFELFRKNDIIGFGVRTMNMIWPGQIVSEFAGEVMNHDELSDLAEIDIENRNYAYSLFDRKYDWDNLLIPDLKKVFNVTKKYVKCEQLFVNPWRKGNISRFISHGCLPNVGIMKVISNNLCPTSYRLLLVAIQPIGAGEELFIDYGFDHKIVNNKCLCGHIGCRTAYKEEWKNLTKNQREHLLKTKAANIIKENQQLEKEIEEEDRRNNNKSTKKPRPNVTKKIKKVNSGRITKSKYYLRSQVSDRELRPRK